MNKSIFDVYIKVTAGLVKWLLFLLLEMIGPAVRVIGGLMSVGGLIAFLICLVAWPEISAKDGGKTMAFAVLSVGLVGVALITAYEIMIGKMYLERINEEDTADSGDITWFDWLGLFVLFILFSVGSYHYYHLRNAVEAMAVGLCYFVSIGVILGALRWLEGYGGSMFRIGLQRAREAFQARGRAKMPDAANDSVVVPFRRRNDD